MDIIVRFKENDKLSYIKYQNITDVKVFDNKLYLYRNKEIKAMYNIDHIICYESY